MVDKTPRILCALTDGTYRRVMTRDLEARLQRLGGITYCLDPGALSDADYGALWEGADAALTGWGLRAPTVQMLESAKDLRIICHAAGSVRMLPRRALELGITVTSARAAIAPSVAEYCLLSVLTLLRRYRELTAEDAQRPDTETLYGKTVGLVGFGVIGRLFRKLLEPFGCRVLVHDPYLAAAQAAEARVELVELDVLLREARIVSLHSPDIPETRGMIGARELALLQDNAIFLNSARGRLVDTEALTAALREGRFRAALDVTDPEPLPADHPLRGLPNVLLTPHIAGPTTDELPALADMAITELERHFRGESPLHAISLGAYDIMSY